MKCHCLNPGRLHIRHAPYSLFYFSSFRNSTLSCSFSFCLWLLVGLINIAIYLPKLDLKVISLRFGTVELSLQSIILNFLHWIHSLIKNSIGWEAGVGSTPRLQAYSWLCVKGLLARPYYHIGHQELNTCFQVSHQLSACLLDRNIKFGLCH